MFDGRNEFHLRAPLQKETPGCLPHLQREFLVPQKHIYIFFKLRQAMGRPTPLAVENPRYRGLIDTSSRRYLCLSSQTTNLDCPQLLGQIVKRNPRSHLDSTIILTYS